MPRWLFLSFAVVMGCTRPPPPDWATSPPSVLCRDPRLEASDFCMPASALETVLRRGDLRVTDAALSESGVTAPTKLRIETTMEGAVVSFSAKFKPAPVEDVDAFNNSPRRELAAYQIQKLFLDEDDWVVPPTVLRCLELDRYGKWLGDAEPWPKTGCTLGILAFWLDSVTDEDVFDGNRFKRDARYRFHLSNANVLTTLIGHQDSLGRNFVVSTDPARPRVFAIDNGLAFGAMQFNPILPLADAWAEMRVPVVPKKTAARLMSIDAGDLQTLRVVAQLERRDGKLVHVRATAPMSPREGVRKAGEVLQLGLTVDEVTSVHQRLGALVAELQKEELREIPEPSASRSER